MTKPRKSGGQSTAAARQAAWKARTVDKGLKKVAVIVPVSREDDIREVARQMREGTREPGKFRARINQREDLTHEPIAAVDNLSEMSRRDV